MRWKTTALLLATAVGLGAYISLYELRQPDPENRERRSRQVLNVPETAVTRLQLELPAGTMTLTRRDDGWRLEPDGLRADDGLIGQLLIPLSPLTAERILQAAPDKPLDLAAYRLQPPLGRLTFVADGRPTTLSWGDTTTNPQQRYLRLEDRPEVFVVPGFLFETANKPMEDYRDHLLIRLNPWELREVQVAAAGASFTLVQDEHGWSLTQPFADRADRAEAGAFVNQLGNLSIHRFVTDQAQPAQRQTHGLETPATQIALTWKEPPERRVTLGFGAPMPSEAAGSADAAAPALVAAARSDEPASIYAVTASALEALAREPQRLRATACFDFFTSQVAKVEWTREGTAWTMERQDGAWRVPDRPEALAAGQVDGVLSRLADVRLSGFPDEAPADLARYGLAPPAGAIRLWTVGEDEPQQLEVGAAVDASGDRYGRIAGRSPVVRLPAIVSDLLQTSPDSLAAAPPAGDAAAPPAPASAP